MMTSTDDKRFVVPAWGISFALHGAAVGMALLCAVQVKPILEENLFTWEVALVQSAKPEPVVKPAPVAPTPPVKPMSEPVRQQVAPQRLAQMVQPVMEPAKPIEPKQPKTEPIMDMKEPEPVVQTEPVAATSYTVAAAASPEPVETAPVAAMLPRDAPPVQSSQPEGSQALAVSGADPAPLSEAASGPVAKADNRWLAESLWRRVAELKRYPNSARMNGQEGKVVLKAVIRSDGQLADVSVQKSSGHSVLDAAAIEAVKLACPLHMKHAIGKPLIVVSLPIVYSLTN